MPPKHNPTPEERDERVKLPLDPETAIEAILATGSHRDEDEPDDGTGESTSGQLPR